LHHGPEEKAPFAFIVIAALENQPAMTHAAGIMDIHPGKRVVGKKRMIRGTTIDKFVMLLGFEF
jgi:hypothetical protein